MKKTQRGFHIKNFTDERGNQCSLQRSSQMEPDCIWLGCDDIGLKKFTPTSMGGNGWEDVTLEHNPPYGISHIANTRMHLTREMVEELLPHLQAFVETGELVRA